MRASAERRPLDRIAVDIAREIGAKAAASQIHERLAVVCASPSRHRLQHLIRLRPDAKRAVVALSHLRRQHRGDEVWTAPLDQAIRQMQAIASLLGSSRVNYDDRNTAFLAAGLIRDFSPDKHLGDRLRTVARLVHEARTGHYPQSADALEKACKAVAGFWRRTDLAAFAARSTAQGKKSS